MSAKYGRPIVVGVNETLASQVALSWAVDEAKLRRRPLHVVGAMGWAELSAVSAWPAIPPEMPPSREAREAHQRAVDYATSQLSSDLVSGEFVSGSPLAALRATSASAELVVVGSRGRGRVVGAVLGSVSQSLLSQAGCPVAVLH